MNIPRKGWIFVGKGIEVPGENFRTFSITFEVSDKTPGIPPGVPVFASEQEAFDAWVSLDPESWVGSRKPKTPIPIWIFGDQMKE